MNTIGHLFRLTTFGESHGTAIGGVIDGCPSQLKLDFDFIDSELQRRKTAQAESASQRKEPDHVEWLSGLLDGVTLGTPIAFMVTAASSFEEIDGSSHIRRLLVAAE